MDNEKKQAYTRRITAAGNAQLITVIYDLTLDYMDDALHALEEADGDGFTYALVHARACLDDLLSSLDMKYEISGNLGGLYLFAKKELTKAQAKNVSTHIGNARKIIQSLRDAWVQIEDQGDSSPAFDNAETVYAGLTYGRGTLNESVSDPGANRGLTV